MIKKVPEYILIGAAIFGLATIILAIIMLFTFPMSAELSEGFRSPIIAFEFAKTEADLAFLSGSSELSRLNRENMDAGHQWDMFFPFAYGGFIALMLLKLARGGRGFAWLGILFALLIIPFDLNENQTLLQITAALEHSNTVESLLQELHTATWLKWGAIGLSISVLSLGFFANKEYSSAALSTLTALSIAASWGTNAQPNITEAMSVILSLFFLIFAIQACIQIWRLSRHST